MKLDHAIDHVAKRMTHVEVDAQLAQRIIAALPDRRRGWWWMAGPAFAAIVLIVGGTLFLGRTQHELAPLAATPMAMRATPLSAVAAVNPPPARTTPLERLEPVDPLEPMVARPDHEFSLPSLASVEPMSMKPAAPDALPEEAPLSISPLTVDSLALDPVQQ